VIHFTEQFLGPVEEGRQEGAEEDHLGYYEDGTKRTLTDEQIAIFRHSEIQALLRDRRRAAEAKEVEEEDRQVQNEMQEEQNLQGKDGKAQENMLEEPVQREDGSEDGELGQETETQIIELLNSPPAIKKKLPKLKKEKAEQKSKQKSFFKQYIKPDLRKRTWDKVDTGLDSLDYDEGETSAASTRPSQRRRISYDDD
jgi:hypothetical protein